MSACRSSHVRTGPIVSEKHTATDHSGNGARSQEIEHDYVDALKKVRSLVLVLYLLLYLLLKADTAKWGNSCHAQTTAEEPEEEHQKTSSAAFTSLYDPITCSSQGPPASAFAQVPTSWREAFAAVRHAVEDEARAHRSTAEGLDRLLVRLSAFRDDRVSFRRIERALRLVHLLTLVSLPPSNRIASGDGSKRTFALPRANTETTNLSCSGYGNRTNARSKTCSISRKPKLHDSKPKWLQSRPVERERRRATVKISMKWRGRPSIGWRPKRRPRAAEEATRPLLLDPEPATRAISNPLPRPQLLPLSLPSSSPGPRRPPPRHLQPTAIRRRRNRACLTRSRNGIGPATSSASTRSCGQSGVWPRGTNRRPHRGTPGIANTAANSNGKRSRPVRLVPVAMSTHSKWLTHGNRRSRLPIRNLSAGDPPAAESASANLRSRLAT